jgi:hypothetical protein
MRARRNPASDAGYRVRLFIDLNDQQRRLPPP